MMAPRLPRFDYRGSSKRMEQAQGIMDIVTEDELLFMKHDGVRGGRHASLTPGEPECWSMHTGVDNDFSVCACV